MVETPYHDYNRPDKGTEDWHQPLNNNFGAIDADIEVRDSGTPSANNYDPKQGAKYLDTASGVVYVGELDSNDSPVWTPAFALAGYDDSAGRPQFGQLALGTLTGSVTGGTAVSTLAGSGLTIASGSLGLANDSVTVAGNSVSLGGSTNISHADLSNITSSDHHTRPSAGNALADNSNTFDVQESSIDHNNLTNSGQADAHHTRPSAGSGLAESSNTFAVAPSAFAGTYLSEDGSSNLTVDARSGLENDGSGNLQAALGSGVTFDGSSQIALASESLTVAGNSVSLGGSTGVDYVDLGDTGSSFPIPNGDIANSSVTVDAGNGLSGGGSVSLGNTTTLDVASGGISTAELAANAVTKSEIDIAAVGGEEIGADAVNSGEIADSAVGTSELASGAVTSTEISDGTITTGDLGQNGASDGQVLRWNGGASSWETAPGSLSVAGNSVSLGGSTGVAYADLSDTSSFPIPNGDLANSSVTVSAGSGLQNGGQASLGGSTTLDIDSGRYIATSSGQVDFNGPAEWSNAGDTTNTASSTNAVVAGGTGNTASAQETTVGGGENNEANIAGATISGGFDNLASGGSGVVGGGAGNEASGSNATVAGGIGNTASGFNATVGGGDGNKASGNSATVAGGQDNTASGQLSAIAGGGGFDAGNTVSGELSFVGSGEYNVVKGDYAVIAGGGPDTPTVSPSTSSNTVYDDYGVIGGGGNNQAGSDDGNSQDTTNATFATVGGGSGNEASGEGATVAGGQNNTASAGGATVAGGGHLGTGNTASAQNATVGGGNENTAGAVEATVGGGQGNTASDVGATVAGGSGNEAGAIQSSVGGGQDNTANGQDATVSGGSNNTASSTGATVGGGSFNTASGFRATVPGGSGGAATDDGSFVLNDGTGYHAIPNSNSDGLSSNTAVDGEPVTGAYTFSVSATSGVRFITGGASSPNVTYIDESGTLVPGGNTVGAPAGQSLALATDDGSRTLELGVPTSDGIDIAGGNIVAGHPNNTVNNSAVGVVISGGGSTGGNENTVGSDYATVGGGQGNTASGEHATVSGGQNNTASGDNATVVGGANNEASGLGATVAGGGKLFGDGNTADGADSFAAGNAARAVNREAFVWNTGLNLHDTTGDNSDDGLSSGEPVASNGNDPTGSGTFTVGATGGVRFITDSDRVTYLDDASAGWTSTSTRAAKTSIDPVDPEDALAGVEEMEVATWEYTDEDGEGAGTTHIGPMAEDFHDAFDVGSSDEHINSINADGVAFAAIQGLSAKLDERDERIETLERENERLRERNTDLETRIAAIEDHLDIAADSGPSP